MFGKFLLSSIRRRICSLPAAVPAFPKTVQGFPAFTQTARGLKGIVIGENVDGGTPEKFRKSCVGQILENPYELTIDQGWLTIWHLCFFQHDRLHTSATFAESLNFKDRVLPFSLVAFQTASMSHLDELTEVLEYGMYNAVYVRPAYCGDTFKKQFTIVRMRPTIDGSRTVITYKCELYNQRNQIVFTCDKAMVYPYPIGKHQKSVEAKTPPPPVRSHMLEHIKNNASSLPASSTLAPVEKGQLVLHTYAKAQGTTMAVAKSGSRASRT